MQAEEILSKLSLTEKIALCSGENFWQTKELKEYGLPALFMCDGPHGLRKQVIKNNGDGVDMLGINDSLPATCFPTAVTSGASWDVNLMEEIGEAIGAEAHQYGVGLVLGPGANIKRNPLCGRNFEYFSEDPHLAGNMAAGLIRGIQKNGTGACLKHFACNNQEYLRFTSNSKVDDRSLREIYLRPFEIAVKKGHPSSVMGAYNKINGTHCTEDKELLSDILRDEWGFDGMVVTDWGAMYDRMASFKAGCDLNMPGGSDYMEHLVEEMVEQGQLSEDDVDKCALRVLKLMVQAREALSSGDASDLNTHTDELIKKNNEVALKAAESGAVLLKNDGILPLAAESKVALIGIMAASPRYQGAGSSHINPYDTTSAIEAFSNYEYAPGCDEKGHTTEALLEEAAQKAMKAPVAIVFVGLPDRYESEGFDRDDMKMPRGHRKLIETVRKANPNTIVVLCCGAAVECPWADDVRGILYMGLGGQAMGEAVKRIVYGEVNPSGKLTESWPYEYEDHITSSYYGHKNPKYKEGIYVGYRYFDKVKKEVRWPFGYGLSYTTFKYSDLKCDGKCVLVTVTNTGDTSGAEVVQVYISPEEKTWLGYRAKRELRAFDKVFLQPGESRVINLELDDHAFDIWNDGWVRVAGTYTVSAGGLSTEVVIEGEDVFVEVPDWYNNPIGEPHSSDYRKIIKQDEEERELKKGEFTMESTLTDMLPHSALARFIYNIAKMVLGRSFPKEERNMENPEYKMLINSSVEVPMRSLQIFGAIKGGLLRGVVIIVNGHFFKGIKEMFNKF